jgi:hypothetical protein
VHYGDKNPMKLEENKAKLSKRNTGRKHTVETKEKLSQIKKQHGVIPPSRKGTKRSIEDISKMIQSRLENGKTRKKVYQYTLDGELIKIWNYSKEIKLSNPSYSIGNINSVCRGERNFAHGYIWKYEEIKKAL